jgi:uncharacterized protein (TIGR01777 family)
MKIIIAGGTGFIGKALVDRLLGDNHTVVVLTRNVAAGKSSWRPTSSFLPQASPVFEQWDAYTVGTWSNHVDGADAVINLTGELIAGKRWTQKQKEKILTSRVTATRAIVNAIERATKKPSVLINASAVGYYGNVPEGEVTESFPCGSDFLAGVCRKWEEAALIAQQYGVRVVTPRFGVVLSRDGGALQRMMIPFRLFAGGYLGTGTQWFPWIHRDDLINAMLFSLQHSSLSGAVNFVAPHAVTMKEFCKTLGEAMHSPSWTFVPSFVLRILLGEMAEMLLTGQKVIPKKLLDEGFKFLYSELSQALKEAVK